MWCCARRALNSELVAPLFLQVAGRNWVFAGRNMWAVLLEGSDLRIAGAQVLLDFSVDWFAGRKWEVAGRKALRLVQSLLIFLVLDR